MIFFAFVLFAVLVLAWIAAPSTEKVSAKAPAPSLKLSETAA
jgi:hypothetical protein